MKDLILNFKIPGKVKAKQSVKFAKIGNFIKKYTPEDMVNYANWVKQCFTMAYPNHLPSNLYDCELSICIKVFFQVPKSFSNKKRELALRGLINPTVKPDWDNISKNICDALNGIAFPDDKAIVNGTVEKYYGDSDYVEVIIRGSKFNGIASNFKYSSTWYTTMNGFCIGIVKVHSSGKFYIGIGKGLDQSEDEKYIAEYGTPIDLNYFGKYMEL